MQSLGSKCDRPEQGSLNPRECSFYGCFQKQKGLSPQKAHPTSHHLKVFLPWAGFSYKTGFIIGTEYITVQSTVLRHSESFRLNDI